ncbi:MAG: hypothetical protein ACO3N7_07820 [Kiritimatiellia bacterium]
MNRFLLIRTLVMLLVCSSSLFASDAGIDSRLRDAAAELSLAEGSLARVEATYREMQKNPEIPPEQILAMEQYVQELRQMVKLRRETLQDLEKISGREVPEMDPQVAEGMKAFEDAIQKLPGTEDPETEAERLDREFRASLEDFDGMILSHNAELEARMDERIAKSEAAAGSQKSAVDEAEALLKSMGVETGSASASEGEGEPASAETAGTQGGGDASAESASGQAGEGMAGSGGGNRPPARQDEDIVARQLREAAEKETDPVLREKLWKEYEAYLDGRS